MTSHPAPNAERFRVLCRRSVFRSIATFGDLPGRRSVFVSGQTGNPEGLVSVQTMPQRPLIPILDADPELGAGLNGDARAPPPRIAGAVVTGFPPGPFQFPSPNGESAAPAVGLL